MLNIRNGEIVKYNNVVGRIEYREGGFMLISIYNKNMVGIDNLDILTTATDEEKLTYIADEVKEGFSAKVVKVHIIGDYQFVEITINEDSHYIVFVDFIDINRICYSLDSAIIKAIAYKNDTMKYCDSACKLLDIDI